MTCRGPGRSSSNATTQRKYRTGCADHFHVVNPRTDPFNSPDVPDMGRPIQIPHLDPFIRVKQCSGYRVAIIAAFTIVAGAAIRGYVWAGFRGGFHGTFSRKADHRQISMPHLRQQICRWGRVIISAYIEILRCVRVRQLPQRHGLTGSPVL